VNFQTNFEPALSVSQGEVGKKPRRVLTKVQLRAETS